MRNLKLAFRTLAKTPFVTTIAVLSLALGIGANAAIFSLFDQMLLRALPVHEPERLINLQAPGPKPGSQSCNNAGDCEWVFSYPMYRDLERADLPVSLAGHVGFGASVAYDDQSLGGEGMLVSGSYFPVLGVRPALGRVFGPGDDATIDGHPVAVLSHAFWETNLGADPAVVGRQIVVNGTSLTIVGVAAPGFQGTTLGTRPLVFVPLTMRRRMNANWDHFENRRSYWLYVFGRLDPGVTPERATVALNGVYRPIITGVEAPLQEGMSDATMQRFRARQLSVEDGRRGQSSVHGEARTPLTLLFAITGIVLLIACANIANLLLARGAGRSAEMAVRLSLGASRRQVLAQLLTESLVLAVLGGLASLLVARWTLSAIAAMLPDDAASTLQFELQLPVVLFAAALAIGTGLVFGMFPALHSTRPDLVTTIRASAGQLAGARAATRFRTALVTAQIALSMALLICAGLFVRSLVNVSRVDLGVTVDNVVTFSVAPQRSGYDSTRSRVLYDRIEEELAGIPGVTGVTSAVVPILAGNNWGTDVGVQGFQHGPDIDSNARFNMVGADYFSTLGMPMLQGRGFTRADSRGSAEVAVVNEAFARKFNMGNDVVGKFMSREDPDSLTIQIVGLVKDAKYSEVKDDVPPLFFIPHAQLGNVSSLAFYVRTSLPPETILRDIQRVVASLDPALPVGELKTMPQQIRENVFLDRMISTLSAAFAILATLLAAVGLYGVLAYTVAQRTREIGVRMALGADGRRVRGMVLWQVGRMLLVGGIIGIAGALALGRAAGSLLFGLQGHDPLVVVLASITLAAVALGAGFLPAARAARVDPMRALRYE